MFSNILFNSENEVTITVSRNNEARDITLLPADTENGPRLGLWLRDSTAGLGTITCYTDKDFVALGHGICDIDTGGIMPVKRGVIQECGDITVQKGKNGDPGAMTGTIDGNILGSVSANTRQGLCGRVTAAPNGKKAETAKKNEIHTGAASILTDIDGGGVKEYSVDIQRINPAFSGEKDMVIKITDKALIAETGGIVQGMSGSPIIQDGRLVGAVTHVFVNDSTRGYGIFIENMLPK